MIEKVNSFYYRANKHRSMRNFSDKAVAKEIMEKLVMTGSATLSEANNQDLQFCLISSK